METKLSETLMDKITRYAPALFERAESEERKKIQAERKAKAGELARVEQETQERVEMLLDEQKKAEALVKQAEAALSEKKEALVSVKSSLWSARSRGGNQAAKLREYLLETASPEIDETIQFFNDKLTWLRSPGRISQTAGGAESNFILWKKTVKAETNRPAVLSALDYCMAAIETLGLMKLQPELDPAAIERLKAEIPSIDEYTPIEGEKNLDRLAGPGAGLMSESESDWQTGRLIEKANRTLRKA